MAHTSLIGAIMTKRRVFIGVCALLVGASASSTKAIPIYDNLEAGYYGYDSVGAAGPTYDSFTSSGSIQAITGLQLALYGRGGAGTITVGLFSDSSTAPGALIATLATIDDTTISAGLNDYTLSLLSDPLLAAGTRYWIGLSDTGTSTEWSWSLDVSGTGVSGEYFANASGVAPNSDGPYQMTLSTSVVPEPSAWAMVAMGICTLLGGLRLNRRLS
jgi:hypothetical protein